MEFTVETFAGPYGATGEIASITLDNGATISAQGSYVDFRSGVVGCYAIKNPESCKHGTLQTFDGQTLGTYRVISEWKEWRGYYPLRMQAIRARFRGDSREWHGRFSDRTQYVRLRPVKDSAR